MSIVKSEHVWLVEHETDMLTLAMTIGYQTSESLEYYLQIMTVSLQISKIPSAEICRSIFVSF